MRIKTVITGELAVNCYVIINGDSALVIDPGGDVDKILSAAEGANIVAVLLTHGHFDHTGAAGELQKNGAKLYVSKADSLMLKDSYTCLAQPFGYPFNMLEADVVFDDNDIIDIIGVQLKVLLTPGHTCGSVCFYTKGILFSGDTLFNSSIGRTDFPGGSFQVIEESIKQKLYTLPGDTVVYPGHGDATTIENEKLFNPYVR